MKISQDPEFHCFIIIALHEKVHLESSSERDVVCQNCLTQTKCIRLRPSLRDPQYGNKFFCVFTEEVMFS